MSRVPVLVILGATGSGKSRLGIELAQRFLGEIISADSMQVYKGLDIVTAKVTKEERQMAVHHMLDVLDPLANFTVTAFRDMALPIIDNLLTKKRMPIIVGGTMYYIESLLWRVLVAEQRAVDEYKKNYTKFFDSCDSTTQSIGTLKKRKKEKERDKEEEEDDDEEEEEEDEEEEEEEEEEGCSPWKKRKLESDACKSTTEQLYRKLQEVDAEMARKLHPNNRRKIIRSLEVFEQFGMKHSEILKAQRLAGGSGLGGPLRYPNSIILWLRCDMKILGERLDRRVDAMIEAGLLDELLDFHRRYNEERIKSNTSADYTKGIFQSIGFKEFHNYLILPEEEKQTEKGQKLLKQGIEDLKLVTKRYAKKQEKWIFNRLVRRADRQVPPLYSLDTTDVTQWNSNVFEPAAAIVSAILRGEKPEQRPCNENVEDKKTSDSSNEELHYCEVCERSIIGELQWNAHINGLKHKKVAKKKAKCTDAVC